MQEEKKLKANIPAKLKNEDLFNTKPKADTIKDFIKNYPRTFKDSRMIVLYGEWGSGKTSILNYLKEELNDSYETIFFEAWKYEKDGNLPLSLFDAICDANKDHDEKIKETINSCYKVLKAFTKSTKLKFGVVSFDSKVIFDEIEKNEIESDKSLYIENKQFAENFLKIEKKILKKSYKKLIVFVDDLDRCEPENVLDLLSAIKLFFSYGQDIIYFCAVDKEAVNKAVKIKYHDIIKSDEYLEKIFDISFNMPISFEIDKLLEYYFDDDKYSRNIQEKISTFLKVIRFTNPRHLKKILNKYLIIEYIKAKKLEGHSLIPELTGDSNKGVHIILVLFFIVLYEFYPGIFSEIENYDEKIKNYVNAHQRYRLEIRANTDGKEIKFEDTKKQIFNTLKVKHPNLTFKEISDGLRNPSNISELKFVSIFTPNPPDNLVLLGNKYDIYDYIRQFSNPSNDILINFSIYIKEQLKEFISLKSEYNFWDFFIMCKTVL